MSQGRWWNGMLAESLGVLAETVREASDPWRMDAPELFMNDIRQLFLLKCAGAGS